MRNKTVVICIGVMSLFTFSVSPVRADHNSTHTKCTALVIQVNKLRTRPDLRTLYALCVVGRERSKRFAEAGRAWHNIDYAVRRVREMTGIRCFYLGEAIGYTSASGLTWSSYAARFAKLWQASPIHWSILNDDLYHRGGGSMTKGGGRTYVAFYVYRRC